MSTENKNPYAILGIRNDASQEQVKAAYRAAALENHPDRFQTYVQRIWATRKMQEINEAYAVLRDPQKRKSYDSAHPVRGFQTASPKPTEEPRVVPPPPANPFSMENVAYYGVWILASLIYTFVLASMQHPKSVGAWVMLFVASLFISPLILMALAMALAVPLVAIAVGFQGSFSRMPFEPGAKPLHVMRDFLIRIGMLGIVLSCFGLMFHFRITSDVLFLILLAWTGSVVGELVAMALWVVRARAVVERTALLLRT